MNISRFLASGVAVFILSVSLLFFCGCGSGDSKRIEGVLRDARESGLRGDGDSLAYMIGLNVAHQLQSLDSTLNLSVVCRAILEQADGVALMSLSDARTTYLRHMLYVEPERRREYEERYLSDLQKGDRSWTRTRTGLTYVVDVIGDERFTPKGNNDWVTMSYRVVNVAGDQLYPSDGTARATLSVGVSDMVSGVSESVKMVGLGGKIRAWLPSKLAYGEDGSAELGIAPFESVMYDIEIVDMQSNVARARRQEAQRF